MSEIQIFGAPGLREKESEKTSCSQLAARRMVSDEATYVPARRSSLMAG
jgi:hypothetical protein